MKNEIILVGGGGHCRSVIDVILAEGSYAIRGILDTTGVGTEILGIPIIGTDDEIDSLSKSGIFFHITVGHIKTNATRVKLYNLLINKGARLPVIVSPNAYVSPFSHIGRGSIIMHNALINAGVTVGDNCIINTGAVVEHDSSVGDHCHISTGAYVNGDCKIGAASFIGSNATIVNSIQIGLNNVIGAGAVVLTDTDADSLYAGNPAQLKKKLS